MRRTAAALVLALSAVFVGFSGPVQAGPGDPVTVYRFWSEHNNVAFLHGERCRTGSHPAHVQRQRVAV